LGVFGGSQIFAIRKLLVTILVLVTISVSFSVLGKTQNSLGVLVVLLSVLGSVFSESVLFTVLLSVFGESVSVFASISVSVRLTVLGNLLEFTVNVVETVKEEVENILDDVVEVTVGFFLGDQDQLFDLSNGDLDVAVELSSELVDVGENVQSGKLLEAVLNFAQLVDDLLDESINMFVGFQLVDDVLDDLGEMTGMYGKELSVLLVEDQTVLERGRQVAGDVFDLVYQFPGGFVNLLSLVLSVILAVFTTEEFTVVFTTEVVVTVVLTGIRSISVMEDFMDIFDMSVQVVGGGQVLVEDVVDEFVETSLGLFDSVS